MFHARMMRWGLVTAVVAIVLFGPGDLSLPLAFAEGENPSTAAAAPPPPPPTVEEMVPKLWVAADTVWVLVCGMLVFFMNLGFGCVESGFARAKNCVNILSKNFVVFAATSLAYFLFGWDIMFGAGDGAFFGNSGAWMVGGADNSPAVGDKYQGVYGAISWASVPLWTKFFFQLVFAGTAATIVSGAVAERIKDHTFVLFSFPWNQPNTPLARFKGPRKWQRETLRALADHIKANQGKVDMDTLRMAVASGRGIGTGASGISPKTGTSGISPAARRSIPSAAGRPSPVRRFSVRASASIRPPARCRLSPVTT